MPIDVQLLELAKIRDGSKNEAIRSIRGMAEVYNGLPAGDKKERAAVLERLLVLVAMWVTDHPPKKTGTNEARWNAMKELAETVGEEAKQLGVRMLTGPADHKKIGGNQRSYWLEMLDPYHRPGFELSPEFERWRTGAGRGVSFWQYIGAPAQGERQVKYYGGVSVEETEGRLKTMVKFGPGGLLYGLDPTRLGDADIPLMNSAFSTRSLKTEFSGEGWGIFVVDLDASLYIQSHVEGVLHHSTFLGGSAVQAAGEIVVDNGQVKAITGKSGHYRPSREDLQRFCRMFPQIPRDAVILPEFGTRDFYSVGDFRGSTKPTPLFKEEVEAAIPAWARTGSVQTKIISQLKCKPVGYKMQELDPSLLA